MPPSPEYVVPVVAQRLFGSRFERPRLRRRAPGEGFRAFGEDRPLLTLAEESGPAERVIDRDHGTRRNWREIRAMFTPDFDFGEGDGSTVNDLFAETGIAFRLVAEHDAMISSAEADFLYGYTFGREVVEGLQRPGGLNCYFGREIRGAHGFARQYLPARPATTPYAVLADYRWIDPDPGPGGHWRRSLVTLAHEFGHVLGLGHVGFLQNVMYGQGTFGGSVELEAPQIAHMRSRAAYLSGALDPPARRRRGRD